MSARSEPEFGKKTQSEQEIPLGMSEA